MVTIHDKIRMAVQRNIGQVLSSGEIYNQVMGLFPDTNPGSLQIADHRSSFDGYTQGKYCTKCQSLPILNKLSDGGYYIRQDVSFGQDPGDKLSQAQTILIVSKKLIQHKDLRTERVSTSAEKFNYVWNQLLSVLNSRLPKWKQRIDDLGQTNALCQRQAEKIWTDTEIFEGLIRGVLSNSTDWYKILPHLEDMGVLFDKFDLKTYANWTPEHIEQDILKWFEKRKAGSTTMKQSFISLIKTAQILLAKSVEFGNLNSWLVNLAGQDHKQLPVALGNPNSQHKLPACGVPIAAEACKNWGFDVGKPDRHINRALGMWEMVSFRHWPDRTGTKAPQNLSLAEFKHVLNVLEQFADAVGESVIFVDNVVWLACAKGGLYLSNNELFELK